MRREILLKRYVGEYGLNVNWMEEIIGKALRPVEERIGWEQVMRVFARRSGRGEGKDKVGVEKEGGLKIIDEQVDRLAKK